MQAQEQVRWGSIWILLGCDGSYEAGKQEDVSPEEQA